MPPMQVKGQVKKDWGQLKTSREESVRGRERERNEVVVVGGKKERARGKKE
jgi:hypothetical protein